MNENQETRAELQQEADPVEGKIDTAETGGRPRRRKGRDSLQIVLLLAAAWGVYLLDQYYKHRDDRWYLTILSAGWVIFCSGFLIYCWKKRRVHDGFSDCGSGQWVNRNDDPFTYWYYMVLILFWDGVGVYWLYQSFTKGLV